MITKFNRWALKLLVAVILTGCSTVQDKAPITAIPLVDDVGSENAKIMASKALVEQRYGEAVAYYGQAIDQGASDPETLLGAASANALTGRPSSGRFHIERYKRLYGETFALFVTAGFVETVSGNYSGANDYYRRAANIDPNNETLVNNMAQLELLESEF